MGIIKNSIDFGSGFNIKAQGPIDSRMIVEYISDLTTVWNSDAPAYVGMMVSVLEDGNVYVLRNIDFTDINNWKKQGSDVVDGSGIGKYSLPVMTEEMKNAALADQQSGFNEDSSYIFIDDCSSLSGETTNNTITSVNGSYLYIMMNTIRALQAEVAKLKNAFQYGIHSYNNEDTAMSSVLEDYEDTPMDEPLWALDPYMMSEVFDTADFKTELIPDNFTILSIDGGEYIDASKSDQLGFVNGIGKFSDKSNTLLNLTDSKLVTYLVTNGKDVTFNLRDKDNIDNIRRMSVGSLLDNKGSYNKYGIMLVLSRKVNEHGKNYVYISITNYDDNNKKIIEGYLKENSDGGFSFAGETVYNVDCKYSIESIEFAKMILYRMKFYTKYENFSEEVIPSAPEEDYTYKAAHLTIRSVSDSAMIERIKERLHENELIWNEDKKELNIKSKGKIYKIGIISSDDNTNTEETMTPKELVEKLAQMGIIVNAKFDGDNITNFEDLKLNDISAFTLINSDTEKKYTFTVDPHGKLIGKDESMKTIEMDIASVFTDETYDKKVESMNKFLDVVDVIGTSSNNSKEYGWVRGFTPFYLNALQGKKEAPNGTKDYGLLSDRLRISSFYAPLKTDKVHGCSHSFIELENTSGVDIPLDGVYLHFYRPLIDGDEMNSNKVYHLALDGVIKSGSTYLIRGAQHAEMDDASTFIKVNSYDKEWYYKKKDDNNNDMGYELLSFEQEVVATKTNDGATIEDDVNNKVHGAYKFCLTYGLSDLDKDDVLIIKNNGVTYITSNGEIVNSSSVTDNKTEYSNSDFPNIIKNRRYIDGCGFSSFSTFANPGTYDTDFKKGDDVVCSGRWFCGGVNIKKNTMFRHMFALDPAKQAYNGWTTKDGSRTRYNKATDLQVVSLDKEYIGFPNSNEIVPISRYTPKASYENRNVMTDKTQLDREKPNMVTCSFGINVYGTRCFNWISCGAFDEYLWIRRQNQQEWYYRFESYTENKTNDSFEQKILGSFENNRQLNIVRREFIPSVNNAVYARITSRFPGNNVLFTSHKVVIDLTPIETENVDNPQPVVYEYVVGRADKDGNPDPNHTNEIYTFTLYPDTYEGRTYHITDQQGFHWIEYQVWAATAEKLNQIITTECNTINNNQGNVKVFPILINTGDMTQSGARINEWLDYYNGGKCLFKHMEQMNCVGNNDLCDIDPTVLGTGNDPGKSNAKFFHYFYCYEVPNDERLIVKAHNVVVIDREKEVETPLSISEDRYIPSVYYFETRGVIYVVANSEITKTTCEKWFGLYGFEVNGKTYPINLYTGIEIRNNGEYNYNVCQNDLGESDSDSEYNCVFYPIYETLYFWLKRNRDEHRKKIIFACHEIPFTVITRASLDNSKKQMMEENTRNYPTGSSLLGSHMNQLDSEENRGIYWISRLLEYFGCKLCIGGHKHTYALSYPIKENYQWCVRTNDKNDDGKYVYGVEKTSFTEIKPMGETLEDESGSEPINKISWNVSTNYNEIDPDNSNKTNQYNVGQNLSESGNININSTKLPYIPKDLYNSVGKNKFERENTTFYRCCKPVDTTNNSKYDGFVNYSMCQATGYKLKSNKELPSAYQVFSKLIPMTTIDSKTGGDKPNGNQLYPMFSVIACEHVVNTNNSIDINAIDVKLCRVVGIFKVNGADSFTQTSYGNGNLSIQYLIEMNSNNEIALGSVRSGYNIDDSMYMYGEWVSESEYSSLGLNNKYLYIQY